MKTTLIAKTYRETDVTIKVPANHDALLELVGGEALYNLYVEFYTARTVGSKVDKLLEKNEEIPEEFDLTGDQMPVYRSGSRLSKYPVAAKFMDDARVALIKAGKIENKKLKDIDPESEDFEKVTTVAKHLKQVSDDAKKGLDDLIG